MKTFITSLVLLVILLAGVGNAQAQTESAINGVVYDETNGIYHISFYVAANDSIQPVIIADDRVEEMNLHNESLMDQEIYYAGSFYSYKPGGYLLSVDYPIEKMEKQIPSIALVDEEGRTVDRISTHALGDWTDRHKNVKVERFQAKIDKTEVDDVYNDISNKGVVFFNISEKDIEDNPVILSVGKKYAGQQIFEMPVQSPGQYRIEAWHIHAEAMDWLKADIFDSSRTEILSSKNDSHDRSLITHFGYYPGQNIYIVDAYVANPAILRVCDKKGNIIVESALMQPDKDSLWIIPADKMKSNMLEMVEDGRVVSSVYDYQATVDDDDSIVEFSLRIFDYGFEKDSLHRKIGRFDAIYTIPEEFKNPEVIEITGGSMAIKNVTAGQTYLWSREGDIHRGEYMYVIILDNGKVKAAERARVISFTWGPQLHFDHINVRSPGLREIIKNSTA